MIKELKTREGLDLSSYDLEYAELLAIDWREKIKEIELTLRCAVSGWHYRKQKNKLLRFFNMGALIAQPCIEYFVYLTFLGVTDVRETLLSQGHKLLNREPTDKTWMQSLIFSVDDIRIVRTDPGLFRFYLRTEDLKLDFTFVDCMHLELCAEEA